MKSILETPARAACHAILTGALLGVAAHAAPITYQGHLENGASPANGNHDFEFTLKDALTGGSNVGTPAIVTRTNLPVVNGVFTTTLDFGDTTFSAGNRWLEVKVNGTTLSPRQGLTPAPLALR
jgi:hypothetical protein